MTADFDTVTLLEVSRHFGRRRAISRLSLAAGAGDIESFRGADPDLVDEESGLLAQALSEVFDRLPEGGTALVVGHSPMQEAAVYGLTGEVVAPLSKGDGVLVTQADGAFEVQPVS